MLLFSLLFLRLSGDKTEICHLPRLEKEEIEEFVGKHERSMLIFGNSLNKTTFANFAIKRFGKIINFATSSEESGSIFGCNSSICVVPFINGTAQRPMSHDSFKVIDFALFCSTVFQGRTIYVVHPGMARELLESAGPIAIGVDELKAPEDLPESVPFYYVPRAILRSLNITVEPGVYTYKGVERYLMPYQSGDLSLVTSFLSTLGKKEFLEADYYGGFVFDHTNDTQSMLYLDSLRKIAFDITSSNLPMKFAPIWTIETYFLEESKVQFFKPPFFIMFKAGHKKSEHWIFHGDEESIKSDIRKAIAGDLPFTVVSEPAFNNTKKRFLNINYADFYETLKADGCDSLVYFGGETCTDCLRSMLVINRTASILRQTKTKIYHFDASKNDYPGRLLDGQSLPVIVHWKRDEKDQLPILYDGPHNVPKVIEFLAKRASEKLEVPPYDKRQVENDIADMVYKLSDKEDSKIIVTKTEFKA